MAKTVSSRALAGGSEGAAVFVFVLVFVFPVSVFPVFAFPVDGEVARWRDGENGVQSSFGRRH